MTFKEFNENVLDLLSDSVPSGESSYRWTPRDLLRWINDARRAVFSIRPQALYLKKIHTDFPGDLKETDDLDVISSEIPSLINYVVYRCLSRDNEDPETANNAKSYYEKFLMGV